MPLVKAGLHDVLESQFPHTYLTNLLHDQIKLQELDTVLYMEGEEDVQRETSRRLEHTKHDNRDKRKKIADIMKTDQAMIADVLNDRPAYIYGLRNLSAESAIASLHARLCQVRKNFDTLVYKYRKRRQHLEQTYFEIHRLSKYPDIVFSKEQERRLRLLYNDIDRAKIQFNAAIQITKQYEIIKKVYRMMVKEYLNRWACMCELVQLTEEELVTTKEKSIGARNRGNHVQEKLQAFQVYTEKAKNDRVNLRIETAGLLAPLAQIPKIPKRPRFRGFPGASWSGRGSRQSRTSDGTLPPIPAKPKANQEDADRSVQVDRNQVNDLRRKSSSLAKDLLKRLREMEPRSVELRSTVRERERNIRQLKADLKQLQERIFLTLHKSEPKMIRGAADQEKTMEKAAEVKVRHEKSLKSCIEKEMLLWRFQLCAGSALNKLKSIDLPPGFTPLPAVRVGDRLAETNCLAILQLLSAKVVLLKKKLVDLEPEEMEKQMLIDHHFWRRERSMSLSEYVFSDEFDDITTVNDIEDPRLNRVKDNEDYLSRGQIKHRWAAIVNPKKPSMKRRRYTMKFTRKLRF